MSTTAPTPLAGAYALDPVHSSFGFAVRYMGMSTFRGTFDDVTASLTVSEDGAVLEGAAEVASISIRTPEQFRQHVLGDEFFAADRFPQIRFRSTEVKLAADGSVTVDGDLTIRDVTKRVTATGAWSPEAELFGQRKAQLSLATTVDRTEYGITWNAPMPNGGVALADEVEITIELTLLAGGGEA